MEYEGREPRGPYTRAKLKKIFSSWHLYVLTILYMYVTDHKGCHVYFKCQPVDFTDSI